MKTLLSLFLLFSLKAFSEDSCTHVIGYSQVGWNSGWYKASGVFESLVGNDQWQLLWENMAGVDRWQDPNYSGWKNKIYSPCKANSDKPERVILSISGPYGEDVAAWKDAIEKTIHLIWKKLPTAKHIVLLPVVGGPIDENGKSKSCPTLGGKVRASWQHNFIVQAIEQIQEQNVSIGMYPKVEACNQYIDYLGHLSPSGGKAVGRVLGDYFVAN